MAWIKVNLNVAIFSSQNALRSALRSPRTRSPLSSCSMVRGVFGMKADYFAAQAGDIGG